MTDWSNRRQRWGRRTCGGEFKTQTSINRLLVDAFADGSRGTLLQALLLDPTTDSYRAAVHTINKMFRLQGEVLPEMEW